MTAVIIGDIMNSRQLDDQGLWLDPLKELFSQWGQYPVNWEIFRGDNFQVEIQDVDEVLKAALKIKSLIKAREGKSKKKRISGIDVRLAIGIGEKTYTASRISESNGTAFINAGEKFERLKKEKVNIAIRSPWPNFDSEMNLYLKLASLQMDNWTISSAELFYRLLENPSVTQAELGQKLGIEQNSVSRRMRRANAEEILEMEKMFRNKLKNCME